MRLLCKDLSERYRISIWYWRKYNLHKSYNFNVRDSAILDLPAIENLGVLKDTIHEVFDKSKIIEKKRNGVIVEGLPALKLLDWVVLPYRNIYTLRQVKELKIKSKGVYIGFYSSGQDRTNIRFGS